jgi:hypothetical protein
LLLLLPLSPPLLLLPPFLKHRCRRRRCHRAAAVAVACRRCGCSYRQGTCRRRRHRTVTAADVVAPGAGGMYILATNGNVGPGRNTP